jgi:hypothetical protein
MPLFSWAGEFSMSVKMDGRDATVYQEKHHQELDGVETERAAIRHSADKHGRIFDGPLSHNNQRFPYMFQKPVSSATAPDLRVR